MAQMPYHNYLKGMDISPFHRADPTLPNRYDANWNNNPLNMNMSRYPSRYRKDVYSMEGGGQGFHHLMMDRAASHQLLSEVYDERLFHPAGENRIQRSPVPVMPSEVPGYARVVPNGHVLQYPRAIKTPSMLQSNHFAGREPNPMVQLQFGSQQHPTKHTRQINLIGLPITPQGMPAGYDPAIGHRTIMDSTTGSYPLNRTALPSRVGHPTAYPAAQSPMISSRESVGFQAKRAIMEEKPRAVNERELTILVEDLMSARSFLQRFKDKASYNYQQQIEKLINWARDPSHINSENLCLYRDKVKTILNQVTQARERLESHQSNNTALNTIPDDAEDRRRLQDIRYPNTRSQRPDVYPRQAAVRDAIHRPPKRVHAAETEAEARRNGLGGRDSFQLQPSLTNNMEPQKMMDLRKRTLSVMPDSCAEREPASRREAVRRRLSSDCPRSSTGHPLDASPLINVQSVKPSPVAEERTGSTNSPRQDRVDDSVPTAKEIESLLDQLDSGALYSDSAFRDLAVDDEDCWIYDRRLMESFDCSRILLPAQMTVPDGSIGADGDEVEGAGRSQRDLAEVYNECEMLWKELNIKAPFRVDSKGSDIEVSVGGDKMIKVTIGSDPSKSASISFGQQASMSSAYQAFLSKVVELDSVSVSKILRLWFE